MIGVARVCLAVLLAVAPAAAQIGGGALTGDILDQTAAQLPGATVTVTSVSTNLSRTSVTGPDGRYVVPGLAPGCIACTWN